MLQKSIARESAQHLAAPFEDPGGAMSCNPTSVATNDATPSTFGYALFSQFSAYVITATPAVAVGAILAMLSDTMIPEAFENPTTLPG